MPMITYKIAKTAKAKTAKTLLPQLKGTVC